MPNVTNTGKPNKRYLPIMQAPHAAHFYFSSFQAKEKVSPLKCDWWLAVNLSNEVTTPVYFSASLAATLG